MMDWGFTIPNDYHDVFKRGEEVPLGSSREIEIIWGKKRYPAKLSLVNRIGHTPVLQIRYDSSKDLINRIRKTFIHSYVVLKSQKELFDKTRESGKHFRTNLSGGKTEVLAAQPISKTEVVFSEFIKIDTEWNELFERLADENVFGWLFDKEKKYLISRSTNWIKVQDFTRHQNATNVIYYLAHSSEKLLYIGKAEHLGKRVKPGNNHQGMPGDWDLFKYDIVKPEYANILERLEDHTIRAFASIMGNTKNYPTLDICSFSLANSNWKKL